MVAYNPSPMKQLIAALAVSCIAALVVAGDMPDVRLRAEQAAPQPAPDEPLALVNANVVDVRDGRVTANATIVVRDGRIASIGSGAAPAAVRAIDLKGKYV